MHVEFEPYHRSEILHGHLHLGGSNPGGERIEVNSLCLTRGGQPWLPVMGEFHFSRCDPAQWQTELCKMKAGGVTMVSTYLFWIHHEEREGELRFSGRLDVRRFVLCCRRAGLDVVLRIGPWAHGECRNGGFPDWLLHKGIPLRQNHPAYLALVRAWYRSIYRQVRGLLYRDGGPIVGIQLENELVDNSDHLAALKRIAVEEGFEVPLYTVTGWNAVSGARIPTAEVLPEIVDAVGGKELELAAAQQGSHCFGHPVVFPIVETAPAGGQGQHRHTGRAIDLELHFAAEHPAPLFIIGTLHHGSILLNLYELIPHRVVSVPGGSERCAQRGLVLVQVVAQCVEAGVEVAQLQVHHAQKHDGVMGQSHLKNLLLENKKAGHSTK